MGFDEIITCPEDLVTSYAQTRAGFIEAAIAKGHKAEPYIEQAKTLKSLASQATNPMGLLKIEEIQNSLLTASGLSDKSFKYFNENDKTETVKKMISEFLVPAGENFVDELVYRFLLIKGDSLGGSMRNYVGSVAQMKLVRKIISLLSLQHKDFKVLMKEDKKINEWSNLDYEEVFDRANEVSAVFWNVKRNDDSSDRILFFNATIPAVGNNIDISLYNAKPEIFDGGKIVGENKRAIMFGEMKGGIDPAGADEHWKTGNSALQRIRNSFSGENIATSFIAAAIEKKMASEIYRQLSEGVLSAAANMTIDGQFTHYCNWLINL